MDFSILCKKPHFSSRFNVKLYITQNIHMTYFGGKMMKYKIGDVAKLLGITTEAIRYYEDQGIITPTKSANSGYRYYGVWDLHILIRSRSYRQYGYSLSETAELINHYNIPDIVSNLSKKEEDIEKEIIWNINLLKHIRQMQNIITEAENSLGKYRIEFSPPIYRIDVQNGYELYFDPRHLELYRSWIDKVPFVFPSALFHYKDIEEGNDKFSFGLGIDEEYANFLEVKESEDVTFYPSQLSVYTVLISSSDTALSPEKLSQFIKDMNAQGLNLKGDVISRVVLVNKTDGKYLSWHQLWLPIDNLPAY